MIQRTLLRQAARATRSAAPRFAGPVIRPVAQPFAQRTAIIARRGYATEGEKKEGEDAAATEASPEEQLKKEVEAKNKEIVDLKVCETRELWRAVRLAPCARCGRDRNSFS
jgi:molecular chaperone GrpE